MADESAKEALERVLREVRDGSYPDVTGTEKMRAALALMRLSPDGQGISGKPMVTSLVEIING